MCPSSPSAWQIWSWADPFPSLSKKLFYFVKKGLLQTAPKRDRRSRKGPPISFFALYSLRCRPAGMGTAIPPHAGMPQIGCPRSGLFSGRHPEQQELFCAKIIEACCAQDCRLNRRPEEVLNIMRNAPAKPLCKGPRAVVLPLHCLPCRSNALCHKVHFSQWQVLCHSAMPAISEQKTARQKQGAPRRTHPASLFISHNVR